jgi:RIO kinase 1
VPPCLTDEPPPTERPGFDRVFHTARGAHSPLAVRFPVFLAGIPEETPLSFTTDPSEAALQSFLDEGLITHVSHLFKSGKEAQVYLCGAGARTGVEWLAAKVYKPARFRSFRNDAMYQEGRVILDARLNRAVRAKTAMGQTIQAMLWTDHEFQTLRLLHHAGADVPIPHAHNASAILLEYLGDEDTPASQLKDVSLTADEAIAVRDRLLWNVELWLAACVVHGDLSPFNVLYKDGRVVVIDFPQSVDPRVNPHARSLLQRDLENLARFFTRHGAGFDPYIVTDDLWDRFERGVL